MKARMAAESSTRKMIRMNMKNCRERAAVRPTWAPSYHTPLCERWDVLILLDRPSLPYITTFITNTLMIYPWSRILAM